MAASRHRLQHEVFQPNDERLIAVANVTKAKKKKAGNSFLCAAVTTEQPAQASIYKVKRAEKDTYKKKQSWSLSELKLVDGKDAAKDIPEFDLHFDRVYKLAASSVTEKEAFITCLWKLSHRYLSHAKKPTFENINPKLLEETLSISHQSQSVKAAGEDASPEDYKPLTAKEEEDLELMMSQCDFAISNAEAFMEQLSQNLSLLDGANIHSIMGSEDQILGLVNIIDDAIREVNKLENKISTYEKLLDDLSEKVKTMEKTDSEIMIRTRNIRGVIDELKNLVSELEMPDRHQMTILRGDLSTPNGIYDLTMASRCLQDKMNLKIHHALFKMDAVIQQQQRFNQLKLKLAQRLSAHLNGIFIQQGNDYGETLGRHSRELRLPNHHSSHRDLTPYEELMAWLKRCDRLSFTKLTKVYTSSLSKLYEKELKEFFEQAKQKLGVKGQWDSKLLGFHSASSKDRVGSATDLQKGDKALRAYSEGKQPLSGSDLDISEKNRFEIAFGNVLSELEPVIQAEQEFCISFFSLVEDDEEENSSYTDFDGAAMSKKTDTALAQKQVGDSVRRMLGELFQSLEPELQGFINHAEKADSAYSMYMLVQISHQMMSSQGTDKALYFSFVLANCLVHVKRSFDKYVQNQIRMIEDTKVSKKTKCGILPFVNSFENFAEQSEVIFKGSERRGDLDKAYIKILTAVCEAIEKVALEHQKTPQDVVIFENFHHLDGVLKRLKIPFLESSRKEARLKYQQHLDSYVITYLGQPLEKLNIFFEGIEARVAQGIKEDEVGYQLAFSKQELRKLTKEYQGKEVKRGIEALYKKVEKTLCEEENLLQVVWHAMQDEFIKQYKHFEDLIQRCYPSANITLEFNITEILNYFSVIAQSH